MVSIVAAVLCYNHPELTHSIINQLDDNVVVIDNGSQTAEWFPVPILRFPKNRLFSGGWNQAMRFLTSFDYVWMLNSDILGLNPDYLSILSHTVRRIGSKCAVLSPAFNSPHPHMQPIPYGDVKEVPWIDWCAPLVSTRWWQTVGEFDEDFPGYGADLDWCKRASRLGARFYVTHQIQFQHLGSVTAISEGLQSIQGNVGEMNRLLSQKYGVSDWTQMF